MGEREADTEKRKEKEPRGSKRDSLEKRSDGREKK